MQPSGIKKMTIFHNLSAPCCIFETSSIIPGQRCMFDAGKDKRKHPHSAGLSQLCVLWLLNLLGIPSKTWDNVKSLIHGHFISQLDFMGYFKTHLIIKLNWLLFIWTRMNRLWNCLEFHPIVSQQARKADVNIQVGKKKVAFYVCPSKSRMFTKPFTIFIYVLFILF